MRLVIRKSTLEDALYIGIILSSIFSYVFYTLAALSKREYIYWSYANYSILVSQFGMLFVYLKDFLVVWLCVVLLFKHNRTRKLMLCFLAIILYGIMVLLVYTKTVDIRYVLAGIRMYLLTFTSIAYMQTKIRRSEVNTIVRPLIKLVQLALHMECLFILMQISVIGAWTMFGSAGYRFTGTFGNGGTLGYYAIGMVLFTFAAYEADRYKGTIKTLISIVECVFVAIASGSRNAMLFSGIVLLFVVAERVYSWFHISKKTLLFGAGILTIICAFPLYNVIIGYVNRGALSVSGGGRIEILKEIIGIVNEYPVVLLFGKGLGYGTNAAISMRIQGATISDGTFNAMISQFGLIGMAALVGVFIYISYRIYSRTRGMKITIVLWIASVLLVSISINWFEQHAMVVLIVTAILGFCKNEDKPILKAKRSGRLNEPFKEEHIVSQ